MRVMTTGDIACLFSEMRDDVYASIGKAFRHATKPAAALFCECLFLFGLASIVYGVWEIYKPGAFLVAGIIICMVAAALRTESK